MTNSIDREIFDRLLQQGVDVNAPAIIDAEGFGGHTPLFNAIVSCAYTNGRQCDAYMAKALLERGASTMVRASLRKFPDWVEMPSWHVTRDVSAAEWAATFPERGWINQTSIMLINNPAS